ncbi:MAG: ATP-binding protein [Nanoarchaeota archaeon]
MISETELLGLLKEWNLWDQDIPTGIDRSRYVQQILPLIKRKEVLILKGIRRSGKSTIMRQLMKRLVLQGIQKDQVLYVNLEDYRLKDSLNLKLFEKILEVHNKILKPVGMTYFFIDEIQLMTDWERFIRTKYDQQAPIKFIISGSNALLLSQELATLLTGRNLTFEIRPLDYLEYKTFIIDPHIEEYLSFGGFPEVVLEKDTEQKKRILQQYFEDITYRDIINRHSIRNIQEFMKLALFIIENSGTPLSINKLAESINIDNKTAETYLGYLTEAYLLFRVDHFSYSLKKRFDKATQPKYYIADNGFFQLSSNFSKNEGKRFENAIAILVRQHARTLMYWRELSEVDFIFSSNAVNATIAKDIPEREYIGLREFQKKHKTYGLRLITPTTTYGTPEDIQAQSFEEFCKKMLSN